MRSTYTKSQIPKERKHWRASIAMQMRARVLRRRMTPAEKKLWQHIRFNQLGAQFRRQHAVGPYIVDFFCAKAKLVIEVDGDYHADPKQAEYDTKRTEWLSEQKEYRVMRFWNTDVMKDLSNVLSSIQQALTDSI